MARAGIIGANGISGLMLAKLLGGSLRKIWVRDPNFDLRRALYDPDLQVEMHLFDIMCLKDQLEGLDVLFLATPHELSMDIVAACGDICLKNAIRIIDLSGAFRLPVALFEKAYGMKHTAPEWLPYFSYGLMPWAKELTTPFVANPGCYATSGLMALLPLAKTVNLTNCVIDAKSGATGAGRSLREELLFIEVADTCMPYRVGKHQHMAEIAHAMELFAGVQIDFHFSTSLLPIKRGIVSALYLSLLEEGASLDAAYNAAYGHMAQAVRFGQADRHMLSLEGVVGTNRTHIGYEVIGKKVYVFSCIDNMIKGAAGQSIENMERV